MKTQEQGPNIFLRLIKKMLGRMSPGEVDLLIAFLLLAICVGAVLVVNGIIYIWP